INRGDITSPIVAAGIARIHECEDTPLSGCVNEGAVTAPRVAGIACGHSGAGVVGCVNRGAITAIELSGTLGEASGIVNSCRGTVANCQNYGTVIGTSELIVYAAGISVEADAVEYCDNYGLVKVKFGSVAGVIHLSHGSVFRCTNNATVRSADKLANVSAAGIVFENYGSVSECANFGLIHAGRGAGVVTDNYEGAVVSDCFNAGSIEGNYLSGVVYESRPQDVARCYNAGPVSGNKMKAPLICILRCEGAPVNCYYLDTSCDAEDTVGTALTDEQMRSAASYAGFDFTNVWTIAGDEDYPYAELRWAYPDDPIPEEPFLLGDVNGDGAVDSSDALLLLRASMGLAELDEAQLSAGDMNGDGAADTTDALLILRLALGLE
ncbi:MAG: dockerin type I repeat-containing protein, partial [Clostridia bacterium]|nr:dockerin type I repeat-containing protein [Clostridia bacterium]